MLDNKIIEQLQGILANLSTPVTLEVTGVGGSKEPELMIEFARDFASASKDVDVVVDESRQSGYEAPVMRVLRGGEYTGISFCGIPNGHEFTSLILAVLNTAGIGKNLPDEALAERIRRIKGPVDLRTFVSLTCTNCPDVVQALNLVALYNPSITNTMVDGGVAPQMVEKYGVQSVPTVYAGETMLSAGRADLGELVGKLEEMFGSEAAPAAADAAPRRFDVLVAGGGPAGAAAAIYLARKGLSTAVVAGRIGGQVKDTMDIENLISVPLTTGPALAGDLRKHLDKYKVAIFDNRTIEKADLTQPEKVLTATSGERFAAPAVIVATGASWRRLNVAGEEQYIGKGVAFCTHCDGPFFAGKDVAVVGGGNSGVEAAIDLAGICRKVDLFEFLGELKADEVLRKRLAELPNVTVHLLSALTEVVGDGRKVTGIKVMSRESGEVKVYALDGVFVQIGLTPNSAPFDAALKVNSRGEIEADAYGRTSVTGVYAAGDVTDVPYKQIVIAMGQGAVAALSAVDDRMRGITPS